MTLLKLCGVETLGLGTISLSSTAPLRHRVGAGQARNYEQLVLRRDIKRARIHPRFLFFCFCFMLGKSSSNYLSS